jgi:hypothetical protein
MDFTNSKAFLKVMRNKYLVWQLTSSVISLSLLAEIRKLKFGLLKVTNWNLLTKSKLKIFPQQLNLSHKINSLLDLAMVLLKFINFTRTLFKTYQKFNTLNKYLVQK